MHHAFDFSSPSPLFLPSFLPSFTSQGVWCSRDGPNPPHDVITNCPFTLLLSKDIVNSRLQKIKTNLTNPNKPLNVRRREGRTRQREGRQGREGKRQGGGGRSVPFCKQVERTILVPCPFPLPSSLGANLHATAPCPAGGRTPSRRGDDPNEIPNERYDYVLLSSSRHPIPCLPCPPPASVGLRPIARIMSWPEYGVAPAHLLPVLHILTLHDV